MGQISEAERIVRIAASQIGLSHYCPKVVDNVCKRMKEEYVVETWQLYLIKQSQWITVLSAPLGLAVATHHLLEEEEKQAQTEQIPRRRDRCRGRCLNLAGKYGEQEEPNVAGFNPRSSGIPTANHQTVGSGVSTTFNSSPSTNNESNRTWHSFLKPRDTILFYPFFYSKAFFRGMSHAKSGRDLKSIFLNPGSEIMIIVSTIFIGTTAELLSSFPFDSDNLSQNFSMIFIAVAYATISFWLQILVASAMSFFLFYTVDQSKFKHFFTFVRTALTLYNILAELAFVFFGFTLTLLYAGVVASISSDITINIVIICAPALFFLITSAFAIGYLVYISRVIFHGGLLQEDIPANKQTQRQQQEPTMARREEELLKMQVVAGAVWNEEDAIDEYLNTTQQRKSNRYGCINNFESTANYSKLVKRKTLLTTGDRTINIY